MSRPAIAVDDLSKSYRLGIESRRADSPREAITPALTSPSRRFREASEARPGEYPFYYYTLEDPGPGVADPLKIRYRDAGYKGPSRIGSDVWIGYGALILSGVTVGHGSVIGAGAVVAKEVPPFSIAVGSPFEVVEKRFEGDVIGRLLQVRWWDRDPAIIVRHESLLLGDPRAFLEMIDRLSDDEISSFYVIDPAHDEMEFEEVLLPPQPSAVGSIAKRVIRGLTPPVIYSGMRSIRNATRSLSKSAARRGTS